MSVKQLDTLRGMAKQFPHIARVIKKSSSREQDFINYVTKFIKLAKRVNTKKLDDLYQLHRHMFRMSSKLLGVMVRGENWKIVHKKLDPIFHKLISVRNGYWRLYKERKKIEDTSIYRLATWRCGGDGVWIR